MQKRTRLILITAVTFLAACGEAPTAIHIEFPTRAPMPTISPTPETAPESTIAQIHADTTTPSDADSLNESATPTHLHGSLECATHAVERRVSERGWFIFESEELGVEFEYPPPVGDTRYEYAYEYCGSPEWDGKPTGSSVIWMIDTLSLSQDAGYREYFAGAVSGNFSVSESGSPTEAIRFRRTRGDYYLDFIVGREFEVTPLHVIKHPAGVYALVYNPQTSLGPDWPNELAIVLMLPERYHPEFEAINFRLFEEAPYVFAEQLVFSVRFTRLLDDDVQQQNE